MRVTGVRSALLLAALVCPGLLGAQEMTRTELNRHDLTGTDMEVVLSIVEAPPGATIDRHFHNGEEAFYILQGSAIQVPGKDPSALATGASGINVRNVPHAGYKVVGDKPLKILSVHVVDKGKPLYVPAQ